MADPSITTEPSSPAEICVGGTTATMDITASNGTPSLTYQWQYDNAGTWQNVANNTPAGATYSGNTGTSFSVVGIAGAGTYHYHCVVSASGNGCGDATSAMVTVTTVPHPDLSQPLNATICSGGSTTLTTYASGGTGTYSFQWKYSATSGGSYTNVADGTPLGTSYSGGTSNALTVTGNGTEANEDKFYICVLTSNTPAGAGCSATTTAITVTTVADPTLSQPSDATICKGGATTLTTSPSNGTGNFNYQWQYAVSASGAYSNVSDGIPGGVSYSGSNGLSLTITGDGSEASADKFYKCLLTTSTPTGAGCNATTTAVKVTTVEDPTLAQPSDVTICVNGNTTLTTSASGGTGFYSYQWKSSTSANGTYTDITDGTTGGITYAGSNGVALSITADGTETPGDMFFKCYLTTSTPTGAGCNATTTPVTLTIQQTVTPGTIGTNQTICNGVAPSAITSLTAGAGSPSGSITYTWQYSTDAGGTWNPVSGATDASYAPSALTTTTLYQRQATCTLNTVACTSAWTSSVTITVQAVVYGGGISGDQTICRGGDPTVFASTTGGSGNGTITYKWESNTNLSTPSWGLITGATDASWDAPSGLTLTTQYHRITMSTNGSSVCSATSDPVTVTVNFVTAGAIKGAITLCEGESTLLQDDVPVATSATNSVLTYQWEYSTDGTTFSDLSGSTENNLATGTLYADTWYQRVATAELNTIQCTATSNKIHVTVNNITAGTIAGTTTVCETGTADLTGTVPSVHDGVLTYQWHYAAVGSGYSDISGATGQNYTTSALTEDTWFMREVTSTVSGVACTKQSSEILVTVNNLTPGAIAGATTICETGTADLTETDAATYDNTLTYQWQYAAVGSAFSDITGATNATYSTDQLMSDTRFRRTAISTSASPALACSKQSNEVLITVNNLTAGTVSITGPSIICENSTTQLDGTLPVFDGSLTYQWQSHTSATSYANISGATDKTYTTTSLAEDTWYQRVATSLLDSKSCSKTSNEVVVIVNNVTPGSISGETTVCENETAVISEVTAGTADYTLSYFWQSSPDGVNFTTIPGVTFSGGTTNALTQDTWFRRGTRSVSSSPSSNCGKYSNAVLITVNNLTPGTITGATTICESGTAPLTESAVATADNPLTYQWQLGTDGTNFSDISGATNVTYTTDALTQDTWYRRTAISTSAFPLVACSKYSNPILITVNNLTPGSISGATIICEGGTAVLTGTAPSPAPDGSVTYQWQSCLTQNGTYTNVLTGGTSGSYTTSALTTDTWFQRVTTSTLSGVPCSKTTNKVLVTVNNLTAGVIGTTQTICYNTTVALTGSLDTPDGTPTYQWQFSTNGTSYSSIGGATDQNYTTPALSADTWYIRFTMSMLSSVECIKPSNTIKVSVIAQPQPQSIIMSPNVAGVCANDNVSATFSGGSGGISPVDNYKYSIDGGSTWNDYTSGASINSAVAGTARIKIKTYRTSSAAGCTQSNDNLVSWDVYPLPTPSISGNSIACLNSSGNSYITTNVSGHTYLWSISGGTINSGQGTNQISIAWGSGSSGTVDLTEYNSTTWCSAPAATKTVTINPLPTPVISGPASVVTGASGSYSTPSVAGYAYTWTVTGGSFTGQGTNTITVGWGNTPGTGVVNVTVMNISTGCIGYATPFNVSITSAGGSYTISGSYKYFNQSPVTCCTALDLVKLNLCTGGYVTPGGIYCGGGTIRATTTTSSTGAYSFTGLANGSYYIVATTSKPEGGVNTTDAAQVNLWYKATTLSAIEHAKWNAGDVDTSNSIGATDVTKIQNHFLNPAANKFARGVWTFWKKSDNVTTNPPTTTNQVVVNGANVAQDFYGMCTGDFNGSNTPPAGYPGTKSKAASHIELAYQNSKKVGTGQVLELPVRVTEAAQVTAISIIARIPSNLVDISDIYLSDGSVKITSDNEKLRYTLIGDELRISWTSETPLVLSAYDKLLTIKMKTKDALKSSQSVKLQIVEDELNELADGYSYGIEHTALITDALEGSALGINELNQDLFDIECHPNPFANSTSINYVLPQDGQVMIEVYNLLGTKIISLVNEPQQAGNHSVKFEGMNLSPGLYTVTLRLKVNGDEMSRTIKLIHTK